jgi:hypothetical protein
MTDREYRLHMRFACLFIGVAHIAASPAHGREVAFRDQAREGGRSGASRLVPLAEGVRTIYLELDGATVIQREGVSDAPAGESFLCGATVPPFDHTPFGASRSQVAKQLAAAVGALFDGLNVRLVTERPSLPLFEVVAVGGTPALCDLESGHVGYGHLDCDDTVQTDLSFVFSEGITSLDMLAVVIAHEIGHSLGLVHTMDGCDVMSNFMCHEGSKQFLDRDMTVAPDQAGRCGLTTANSRELLLSALGPEQVPDDGTSADDGAPPPLPDAGGEIAGDQALNTGAGGCNLIALPLRPGAYAIAALVGWALGLLVRRRRGGTPRDGTAAG